MEDQIYVLPEKGIAKLEAFNENQIYVLPEKWIGEQNLAKIEN